MGGDIRTHLREIREEIARQAELARHAPCVECARVEPLKRSFMRLPKPSRFVHGQILYCCLECWIFYGYEAYLRWEKQ